jgi:hypothetical protein
MQADTKKKRPLEADYNKTPNIKASSDTRNIVDEENYETPHKRRRLIKKSEIDLDNSAKIDKQLHDSIFGSDDDDAPQQEHSSTRTNLHRKNFRRHDNHNEDEDYAESTSNESEGDNLITSDNVDDNNIEDDNDDDINDNNDSKESDDDNRSFDSENDGEIMNTKRKRSSVIRSHNKDSMLSSNSGNGDDDSIHEIVRSGGLGLRQKKRVNYRELSESKLPLLQHLNNQKSASRKKQKIKVLPPKEPSVEDESEPENSNIEDVDTELNNGTPYFEDYIAEKILADRDNAIAGEKEYLVKWKVNCQFYLYLDLIILKNYFNHIRINLIYIHLGKQLLVLSQHLLEKEN